MIHLGMEIGSGRHIEIPARHMAVVGQTQESGKTTTLEALVARSKAQAIAFVTKRGEGSFREGRRIQPYFRDRADWMFVTSILDATLQEKNKFLRPWIMKICRTTKTLADVQAKVRDALVTAKGINEGVYTQLDAYLELIVPEITRASLAKSLDLRPGLNVMDVSGFPPPMQMLFVQSAIDWVNEHEKNTIVLVPEAWEFIPEGKGSPVKASAINLVRKGAGIGNYIWVDSQDMAGVDKVVLRGCAVWLIGVQREANEIKRNLANIPAGIKRPKPADIARLEKGQFYACWGQHCVLTYVQPAWLSYEAAAQVARGDRTAPAAPRPQPVKEITVTKDEADQLRAENAELRSKLEGLQRQIAAMAPAPGKTETASSALPVYPPADKVPPNGSLAPGVGIDEIYNVIRSRLVREAPQILTVLATKPEIRVEVERQTITVDGTTSKGRIAKLIAEGFYDDGATNSGTRSELKRTGSDCNNATIGNILAEYQRQGFLTLEGDRYKAVPDMKVNVVEK